MESRNYKLYVHISPNGKRYYGITKQKVERRWANGLGYRSNKYFYKAIKKYTWDNIIHEVLFNNLTKEEACLLEQCYIALYNTSNPVKGYNITLGGESNLGNKPSEETRKKISEANKGKHHSEESIKKMSEARKGKRNSEETRKKISEANKGRKMSDEFRKKISEANSGENNPMYGKHHSKDTKKKMSEGRKGKHHSKDTKKKISESNKGKHHSEDTKKKISEANKGSHHSEASRKKMSEGRKGKHTKKVICIETNQIFDSLIEACESIGVSKSSIGKSIKRNGKCGGYHWEYYEEAKEVIQ